MEWKKVPIVTRESTHPKSPEDSRKLYDMNILLQNYLEPYSGDVTMQSVKADFEKSEKSGGKLSLLKEGLSFFGKETVDQVRASIKMQIDELQAIWLNKKYGEEVERLIDVKLGKIAGNAGVDLKKEADNFMTLLRTKPELWAFYNILLVGVYVKKDLRYFRKLIETTIASYSNDGYIDDNTAE